MTIYFVYAVLIGVYNIVYGISGIRKKRAASAFGAFLMFVLASVIMFLLYSSFWGK